MTDDFREPPEQEPKYGDPQDAVGELFSDDPKAAAKYVYDKLWKAYPQALLQKRRAQHQVNVWRREGRSNVYVQKTQDQGKWIAWAPPFSVPPIPVLNKADRLCRRLAAHIWSDDPIPEVSAGTGDSEDQDSAEFAERVLVDLQGEGQLDDLRGGRRAFDRASTFGSGFIRYYIDPKGGGRKPVRIMAKPGAVMADAPFTGPMGEPLEGDIVARYAKEDGTLTDNPSEAATQWVPRLRRENLERSNVRLIPHDAEDIWEAEGVVIGTMKTWGELLDTFPDLANVPEEDKNALWGFKTDSPKDLVGLDSDKVKNQDDRKMNDRDKQVPVFTVYYKSCPTYPNGAYTVSLADRLMPHRQEWIGEVEGQREELDIPLTQYKQFDGDLGLMDLLGNASEARAAMVGALFTYIDQFINRKTYVPTNSILQGKSNQLMLGTHIPINPGGEPKHEDIPDFPSAPLDAFTLMTEEMNDHAMLGETAQGTEVPTVQSGRQAAIIVNQAQAGLSDLRQNTERAYIRGCRIQLQLVRANYTIPQQIDYTGEDGEYRQQWWTGSDLKSAKDVKLKRGSFSMMTPEQKLTMAFQFQQAGLYNASPELFYETVATSVGPTVGLSDDPQRQRIKRQLALWSKGPPEGWAPQQAPMMADPMTGQPVPAIDPMTGMPIPPPPDPALLAIFDFLPQDELQDVATTRLGELKRFMASTKYTRWPPEWRLGVDTEFERMKQAAGVFTVMEQMQMQAEQQQAQMAADAEAKASDADAKAEDGARQSSDKAADRDAKAQSEERRMQHEQQMAQTQQAA